MTSSPKDTKVDSKQLRALAEERLPYLSSASALPGDEALLHELQVHQIELEMQNEALRQAQEALEESRDHYADLYDFSPIGYLSLTRGGLIERINLTGARQLRLERQRLVMSRFARFVVAGDRDRWYRHFLEVIQGRSTANIELQLRRGDGSSFHARLDFLRVVHSGPNDPLLAAEQGPFSQSAGDDLLAYGQASRFEVRIAVTDITEVIESRRAAEVSTLSLRALASELTTAEERERMALDLHDNLGQLLAAIKIKLNWRKPCLDLACAQNSLFAEIENLVDQADRSVRALTFDLSPPALQTLGLLPAIEWLAEDIERKFGVTVRINGDTDMDGIDGTLRTIMFRAVREMLVNVAKHSGVKVADITYLIDDKALIIAVTDHGKGFVAKEVEQAPPGRRGFGLQSTRERLSLIGGQMEIDSTPGGGTMITMSVPLVSPNRPLREA